MKQLIVNLVAFVIIGMGGLSLTAPANATSNTSAFMECSDWELSCDGDYCCSICQDDGSIGKCFWKGDPGQK